MKTRNRVLAVFTLLALLALSCQYLPFSGATESGGILYDDDFENSKSGWDTVRDGGKITDYENGSYRIQVLEPKIDVWANPRNLNYKDVQVEVDATKTGGPDDNNFGVICRYKDEENFYFFIISSDGYYGIGKYKDREQLLIGDELMPPSDLIRQGEASNHIRADCIGNTLSMYVNGQLVGAVEDSDFTSGNVGLLAGTFDEVGTDISFDHFMVMKP